MELSPVGIDPPRAVLSDAVVSVPGVPDVDCSDASAEAADVPRKEGFEVKLNAGALQTLPPRAVEGLESVIGSMNESGLLWRWTTFPITLPKSSIAERGTKVKLEDIFGVDAKHYGNGGMQKLTKAQLTQVRRTGTFENDSGVQGLPDVWQLPRFLACGTETLAMKRRDILAFAFMIQRYIWVDIMQDDLSCRNGLVLVFRGLRIMADLFFGWRWMERTYSEAYIQSVLDDMVLRGMFANIGGGGSFPQVMSATEIPSTFEFTDKSGAVRALDLSYLRLQQVRQCSEGKQDEELRQQLQELDKTVHRRRRAEGSRTPLELQQEELHRATGESMPILGPLLEAVNAFLVAHAEVSKQESDIRTAAEAAIDMDYPVRSICSRWRDQEIEARVERWQKGFCRQGVPFHRMGELIALEKLREHPRAGETLFWWIHILEHKVDSYASAELARVRAKLEKELKPAMTMSFRFQIWLPKNWIIIQGKSSGSGSYHAEKMRTYSLSTRVPGWRLWAMAVLVLEAGNNGLFWLFVSLVYGPLGVCALCSPSAYYPQTKVNLRTGELEKDYDLKMESLCSRLSALWTGIFQSRRNFEELADRGILGKSTTRPFNLAWNYLFRGLLGTLLIGIGQPLLSILHIPICLLMLLTPMVWAPVSAVLGYLACIVVFDWVNPHSDHCVFPLIFGLLHVVFGLLQFVGCSLGLVLLPVFNVLLLVWRFLLNFLWAFYDVFIFCCVVRSRARVPVSDSFTGRRIAGPGLSANYYFQISPAVALLVLQEGLEVSELSVHQDRLLDLAKKPIQDFRQALELYIRAPLGLGAGSLQEDDDIAQKEQVLQTNQSFHEGEIKRIFGDRRQVMSRCCKIDSRKRRLVRQSRADFTRTQEAGAEVVRKFAESRWLPLLSEERAQALWDSKDLAPGDWVGMTRHFLEGSFSSDFVNSSFESMDAGGFRLEVTHQGLEELVESLVAADASVHDPLSKVSPVCPQDEGKAGSVPSVELQNLALREPMVSREALLKVYKRRKGWGINPAPAPEDVVDRPGSYVFVSEGTVLACTVRSAPGLSSEGTGHDGLPHISACDTVQVLEVKTLTAEVRPGERAHAGDAGLVCGRLGPPHSGWVSLARPGEKLRFAWPTAPGPAAAPQPRVEHPQQPSGSPSQA